MSSSKRHDPPAAVEAADPRALEQDLLARCAAAARAPFPRAANAAEASLFLLAAGVLPAQFVAEAASLRAAAEGFRQDGATLDAAEVLRRGWVVSLPRFRQGLGEQLSRALS